MRLPEHCPNPTCAHAHPHVPQPGFFRFKGAFQRRDQRRVRRFQCKACGRHFSEQTGRGDFGQKRPEINAPLARLRASGLGVRASARILGLDRKTVSRRFAWADAQRRGAPVASSEKVIVRSSQRLVSSLAPKPARTS